VNRIELPAYSEVAEFAAAITLGMTDFESLTDDQLVSLLQIDIASDVSQFRHFVYELHLASLSRTGLAASTAYRQFIEASSHYFQ
jgi:hypothetical protein